MSYDITVGGTKRIVAYDRSINFRHLIGQQLCHWTEYQFYLKLTSRSFIHCPKPSQTYLDVDNPWTFAELALIPHWSILGSRVNLAFNSAWQSRVNHVYNSHTHGWHYNTWCKDWTFHYWYHCSYERLLLGMDSNELQNNSKYYSKTWLTRPRIPPKTCLTQTKFHGPCLGNDNLLTVKLRLVPSNYLSCAWVCLHTCVTSLISLVFSHEKKISQILGSLTRKWNH